jgi:hypothetical protein
MKVVDTPTLRRLCRNARRLGANRLLPRVTDRQLDPQGKHVLNDSIPHTNAAGLDTIRCVTCLLKLKGRTNEQPVWGALDFLYHDYNRLPEHEEVSVAE